MEYFVQADPKSAKCQVGLDVHAHNNMKFGGLVKRGTNKLESPDDFGEC